METDEAINITKMMFARLCKDISKQEQEALTKLMSDAKTYQILH